MRLPGRRVLVTGAASGIGLAVARLFRGEGASVAMLDRNATRLKDAAAAVKDAVHLVCDVTEERQVREAVARAVSELGGIDGVVNCAGVDLLCPFDAMTTEEWAQVLAVDLTGPMLASGAALRPLEHRTAYCTAKAGLVMFGKTLAMDLAPYGIRVNAICPGIIDTPMFRGSWESASDPQAELGRILGRYLIKRTGHPDEIAHAALYLTSDESSFVTGVALAVDGGRTFH